MSIPNIFRIKRGSGPPPTTDIFNSSGQVIATGLQSGELCYDNINDALYIGKGTTTITPMLINGSQSVLRFKPTQSYSFSTSTESTFHAYYVDISIIGMGITTNSTITVKVDPTKNTHLILPFVTIPSNNTVRIYSQYSGATVTIDEILIS